MTHRPPERRPSATLMTHDPIVDRGRRAARREAAELMDFYQVSGLPVVDAPARSSA